MIKSPIYPPRPRGKISPSDLPYYEKTGLWVAQRKFNDSRNLLRVDLGLELSVWSRHGGKHVRFSLNKALAEEIKANLKLDPNKTYWLDGGVMNKTKNGPNSVVFFDVLEAGRYFFNGPDQMKRLEILYDICGNPTTKTENGLALKISDNLWLAETFADHFVDRFKESETTDMIEGLVLRRKDSVLDNFGKVEYEIDWQIRCRKSNKNYNF